MAALPKPAERPAGHIGLFEIHSGQLDAHSLDERIEFAQAVGAEAR
ncbi:MAG: hypothetical protein ACREKS_11635 [Candidatus Rokuibacteriota bacterium]